MNLSDLHFFLTAFMIISHIDLYDKIFSQSFNNDINNKDEYIIFVEFKFWYFSKSITSSSQRHYIVSLIRNQRLQIYTLRTFNWNYNSIIAHFCSLNINCNTHQMQYAIINRIIFQKQRYEFKILLNIFTKQRVINFITNSKRTRKMSFIQINIYHFKLVVQ